MKKIGCGRLLAEVKSAAYGDSLPISDSPYKIGYWTQPYLCGCSMWSSKDDLPPEQRTDWILCEDCAVKEGFKW